MSVQVVGEPLDELIVIHVWIPTCQAQRTSPHLGAAFGRADVSYEGFKPSWERLIPCSRSRSFDLSRCSLCRPRARQYQEDPDPDLVGIASTLCGPGLRAWKASLRVPGSLGREFDKACKAAKPPGRSLAGNLP